MDWTRWRCSSRSVDLVHRRFGCSIELSFPQVVDCRSADDCYWLTDHLLSKRSRLRHSVAVGTATSRSIRLEGWQASVNSILHGSCPSFLTSKQIDYIMMRSRFQINKKKGSQTFHFLSFPLNKIKLFDLATAGHGNFFILDCWIDMIALLSKVHFFF